MAKKEEKKNLEETLKELDKKYGKGSVVTMSDKAIDRYEIVPTGSIGIDYKVLGIGGFAKGKLYEIRGWKGSNKTTICGHLSAEAQKKLWRVVYIDSEHALDMNYLRQLGVDTNNLMISQPDYGEAGFEIAIDLINTGEIDLCIIDSDSGLIPKSVMEGEIGQASIGKKAKLNSDFYPKLKLAISKTNTCAVVISQYRDKIGVMFGDTRITQGGHALEYYADVIVDLSASQRKEGDETSGTITNFKTLKNKTYVPFKNYKFPTIFGYGIDKKEELIDLASSLEIIKKWGESIFYKENKMPIAEFTTKLENPEFFSEIKELIISKINV